jgi:hypothetical protein
VEDFGSTGQLVTLGLVDSSIGAMAEGLALVDVEALVAKDMLLSWKHLMGHYHCDVDLVHTIYHIIFALLNLIIIFVVNSNTENLFSKRSLSCTYQYQAPLPP